MYGESCQPSSADPPGASPSNSREKTQAYEALRDLAFGPTL